MHFSRHVRNAMEAWLCLTFLVASVSSSPYVSVEPEFAGQILNVTTPVGREAFLDCAVYKLNGYKVAWLRVDTQTILTIHDNTITKNNRISISHVDQNWTLHIRTVQESDKGWYMCQINTDPMKSQVGYLNVVVPPDIKDPPDSSADTTVREGENVTLTCKANGSPKPNITWRREDNSRIRLSNGSEVTSFDGPSLNLMNVDRKFMGAYMCIASNGFPPAVSKRIFLGVIFPPSIWLKNQVIGAVRGGSVMLECLIEAYPHSVNYWARKDVIADDHKYSTLHRQSGVYSYKVVMNLFIQSIDAKDYGAYRCVSRNYLGETDGTVEIYQTRKKTKSRTNQSNNKTLPVNRTRIDYGDESEASLNDDEYDFHEATTGNSASVTTAAAALPYASILSTFFVVSAILKELRFDPNSLPRCKGFAM